MFGHLPLSQPGDTGPAELLTLPTCGAEEGGRLKHCVESMRRKRLPPLGGLLGKGAVGWPRAGERPRQKTPGKARQERSRPRSWVRSKARSKSSGPPVQAGVPASLLPMSQSTWPPATVIWNPTEHRQSSAPLGTHCGCSVSCPSAFLSLRPQLLNAPCFTPPSPTSILF